MIFLSKVKDWMISHKFITAIIAVVVIGGGYYWYQSANKVQASTKYVLGTVQKETLITSISGSGQVATSNQVDVKAKATGEITYVGVVDGQKVKAGAVLAYIDSHDAQKAVKDAETSLETSQLALEKLLKPADPVDALTIMQSEDLVTQAKQAKQDAQDNLENMTGDEFSIISNNFLELPAIMAGLQDILLSSSINSSQWNVDYYADVAKIYDENATQYRNYAYNSYAKARTAYDKNFIDYKAATRYSSSSAIETLLNETYDTEKIISDAIKNSNNLIQFYQDTLTKYSQKVNSLSSTHLTSLSSYTGKVNAHLTNLSSLQEEIKVYEKTIVDSDRTITERQMSLDKVKAGPEGPDELDVRVQRLAVKDKENALTQARGNLADYTVRVPFSGVISKVSVKKGDIAGSTALATLISSQQIAQISLNEIDTAKIKVGQKATLAFDAIDNLSISGQVAQIDIVGTVSQGVVSYGVQIAFDTQDSHVKPGMSVSASIITDSKTDVLVIPNSAIKNQGGISYVEIVGNPASVDVTNATGIFIDPTLLSPQPIEIGLANDTLTEIISGLKEGDLIVAQTVTTGTAQTQSTQSNSLRIPGVGGGGGTMRAVGTFEQH